MWGNPSSAFFFEGRECNKEIWNSTFDFFSVYVLLPRKKLVYSLSKGLIPGEYLFIILFMDFFYLFVTEEKVPMKPQNLVKISLVNSNM